MFDIGFWEISLIGVIALLVVGPERLPGMARNVGFWVGRVRRYVNQVKADVEREINAEELKQSIRRPEGLNDLYDAVDSARETVDEARNVLKDAEAAASDDDTDKTPYSASVAADPGDSGPVRPAPGAEAADTPEPAAPDNDEPARAPKPATWSDAVARELSQSADEGAAQGPDAPAEKPAPVSTEQTDDERRSG